MSYLNYLIEANLALIFFYAMYWLLLRNENQFAVQRFMLIGGIVLSLVFPLIDLTGIQFSSQPIVPSIGDNLPAYWLPEMVVNDGGENVVIATRSAAIWELVNIIYTVIALSALIIFIYRLLKLVTLRVGSTYYRWNGFSVYEVNQSSIAFSFFNSIYLGKGDWTEEEKEKILKHESIHLRQYHSLDILLIQLTRIIFWFNPVLHFYQQTLTQLHEYEADTKSVEPMKEDQFCLLLVKSTLQSSGVALAHHFSKSITLKRITMIKTQKTKIRNWKLASAGLVMSIIFLTVGCQDQVMQEVTHSTITQMGSYPAEVQTELDKLKKQFPNETFSYVEGSKEDMKKMIDEAGKFDYVRNVFVFDRQGTVINGAILSNVARHAEQLQTSDEVFTIVEQTASPKGGMVAFYEYLGGNLSYPTDARRAGIQGRVFIEFVVNKDGSLSDLRILKGIGGGCDEEALRIVSASPAWNPGMQKGNPVRQRMVLPIIFKLDDVTTTEGK